MSKITYVSGAFIFSTKEEKTLNPETLETYGFTVVDHCDGDISYKAPFRLDKDKRGKGFSFDNPNLEDLFGNSPSFHDSNGSLHQEFETVDSLKNLSIDQIVFDITIGEVIYHESISDAYLHKTLSSLYPDNHLLIAFLENNLSLDSYLYIVGEDDSSWGCIVEDVVAVRQELSDLDADPNEHFKRLTGSDVLNHLIKNNSIRYFLNITDLGDLYKDILEKKVKTEDAVHLYDNCYVIFHD